ncbi:unnamed protein product [Orchesella dallaii]|uniref:Uncharacterized protein n=1 Tax=Orchesella dallaii TaxID=48710 RepID=A0ABP1R728_9HEXA
MKGLSINILSEPLKIVPLVVSLVDGMYVFSWLYSFWGKQKQLQKFLSVLQELPEPEPKLKVILLCKRCFYPFLLFITVFAALFVHGKFSWAPKQMFFLDYYNSTTIMHGPLELEEQTGGKEFFLKILEELAFYLDIFVFQCVDILVILMTKSAYLTVGWYIAGAFPDDINTNAHKKDLGIYVEIGKKIQIENFRSAVNETVFQEDPDLVAGGRGVMKKVKHYMQECGVRGGRFFIFSYGFMGSTVGLVVAYAFLLLQLHISASVTSGIS